jgi:hypothetical protein
MVSKHQTVYEFGTSYAFGICIHPVSARTQMGSVSQRPQQYYVLNPFKFLEIN